MGYAGPTETSSARASTPPSHWTWEPGTAEDYIRPPLLGIESRPTHTSNLRFRIVLLVLLAAFCAGLGLLIAVLLGQNDEGSPDVSPHAIVAVAAYSP